MLARTDGITLGLEFDFVIVPVSKVTADSANQFLGVKLWQVVHCGHLCGKTFLTQVRVL